MPEIIMALRVLIEYRMLAAALLLVGCVSWGVARLLRPSDKETRQIIWHVLGGVGFVATFALGGKAGSLPALFLCPWVLFPEGGGLGPLVSLALLPLCGFPVCLFLAGQLDLLREQMAAGKTRWLGPLFWVCTVTGFYAVMLYTRGAGLVPFKAPYAGFFVFAMAAAFEAAYLEREAKRKRGFVCLPVVTAIVMFVILAALDTPATLFMLPMLPLNFCYSVARRGPGREQLRLETELEGVEGEIDGVKGRLDVLWRPERARGEPASFWLLPEAPDSEIMEQLAANGRASRSAGNENGENILDSILEGGRGRCAHGV